MVLSAALWLAGCGEITDASLGACAEPTTEWWPLRENVWWRYLQDDSGRDLLTEKYLEVQATRSLIFGLLGGESAVRTWRSNVDEGETEAYQAGWRWVVAGDQGFGWRADIWLDGGSLDPPCDEFGAEDDLRQCDDFNPLRERIYTPQKLRLDLAPDHLCERSVWEHSYTTTTIEIAGDVDTPTTCAVSTWRSDIARCPQHDEPTIDQWSVLSVDQTIRTPARDFDHCLCVRRVTITGPEPRLDSTYCFAKGVGKVYEVENPGPGHIECLTGFRIDADTGASTPTFSQDCSPVSIP